MPIKNFKEQIMNEKTDDKNVNQETVESKKYKLFSESRGQYSLVDGNKLFYFTFPSSATLAENYDKISFLKEEIFKAMEHQINEEKKKSRQKIITPH